MPILIPGGGVASSTPQQQKPQTSSSDLNPFSPSIPLSLFYSLFSSPTPPAGIAGNCLFEALARAVAPWSHHKRVRRRVAEFYTTATDAQLKSMKEMHGMSASVDLRARADIISEAGEWGEGVDVTAYATITNTVIRSVVLVSPRHGTTYDFQFPPINQDGTPNWHAIGSHQRLYFDGLCHWSLHHEPPIP